MERKAYLGIDLGTTIDGEQLVGIRSATGEALTPSVVRTIALGKLHPVFGGNPLVQEVAKAIAGRP